MFWSHFEMFPFLLLAVKVFSQYAKSFLISKMLLKPLVQCEVVICRRLMEQFSSQSISKENTVQYMYYYIFICNRHFLFPHVWSSGYYLGGWLL